MSLALLWLQFAAAAAAILVSAHFMARAADIVAEKTGLGRSFVGVVMLATATSLPELGNGISSILLVGQTDLAAGDAFGSNLFNLLIIGLLDIYYRRGPLLAYVSHTAALVGALGALMIGIAASSLIIYDLTDYGASWLVSPASLILFGAFLIGMYLIYRAERSPSGSDEPQSSAESGGVYAAERLPRALLMYAITAAIVVVAAIWLAQTGEGIAREMRWERSFVGTEFLALATSLPEIAASFAALRLGAPELAITNVLGSNFFNMGFVLFIDDLAFTSGVLWWEVSDIHTLTALVAVVMTMTVVAGVLMRRRGGGERRFTPEGATLILLYLAVSALVYLLA